MAGKVILGGSKEKLHKTMKCKIISSQTKLVLLDISPDLFYNNIYEKNSGCLLVIDTSIYPIKCRKLK